MIYEWRIFKHRIGCWKPITVSLISSLIAIVVYIPIIWCSVLIFPTYAWFYTYNTWYQILLLLNQFVVVILVIFACCCVHFVLVLIIIFVQILNATCHVLFLVLQILDYKFSLPPAYYNSTIAPWDPDSSEFAVYIAYNCLTAFSFLLSLSVLYSLICSYKRTIHAKHTQLQHISVPSHSLQLLDLS
ncbi:hypothetical protein PRIPAC_88017 [Pristionchus pacificus]|nr:hypothetical protein PRIPAC_88017 [Pristionchus pacificus]